MKNNQIIFLVIALLAFYFIFYRKSEAFTAIEDRALLAYYNKQTALDAKKQPKNDWFFKRFPSYDVFAVWFNTYDSLKYDPNPAKEHSYYSAVKSVIKQANRPPAPARGPARGPARKLPAPTVQKSFGPAKK